MICSDKIKTPPGPHTCYANWADALAFECFAHAEHYARELICWMDLCIEPSWTLDQSNDFMEWCSERQILFPAADWRKPIAEQS